MFCFYSICAIVKTEETISRPLLLEDAEMMKDSSYWLIVWLFDAFLWGGELVGGENLSKGLFLFRITSAQLDR